MAEETAEKNGINLEVTETEFIVTMPFDRELRNKISKVPGSAYDNVSRVWKIAKTTPEAEEALDKVVVSLEYDLKAIQKDRAGIMDLAVISANTLMKDKGTEGVKAMISDYIDEGKSYIGEIINTNGRFAAQFTNFGSDNGAAFVTIHRTANLNEVVLKGDNVRIEYNSNRIGEVFDRSQVKSKEELAKEFDSNLGQEIDGVLVESTDDSYYVSYEINPDLENRLRRIADVEFQHDAKVFEVPREHKEYLIRAVADMRKLYVASQLERAELTNLAHDKMDGAVVAGAYIQDGVAHHGKVLEVKDIYVLQHGGKNTFKLHHKSNLSQAVSKGQDLVITYNKGRGAVKDKNLQKEASASLER